MAGYFIYSLDWDDFQSFVNKPTEKQLLSFAERLSEELDGYDDDTEDDDTIHDWSRDPQELRDLVRERLARPDWYGDLSDAGKHIWSQAVWGYCCMQCPDAVGFRAELDGVYWDLLELAWKYLKLAHDLIKSDVALSAFGRRPYGYTPAAKDDDTADGEDDFYAWRPRHSMHTPDEVRKMLAEFESVAPAIESSRNQQAIRDYDALVAVLDNLDEENRMLFVQVDT